MVHLSKKNAIKKVDGKEYTDEDFDIISTYIKGKEGTKRKEEMTQIAKLS